LDPTSNTVPFSHFYLGSILFKEGKLDDAIAEFGETIKMLPNDAAAHRELGLALFKRRRLEEAVSSLRTAMMRVDPLNLEEPGDIAVRTELASMLQQRGYLDEAIAEFREIIKLDSTSGNSHYHLGDTLASYAVQQRSAEKVVTLVESCQLLVEGKRLASLDPNFVGATQFYQTLRFEEAIERVDEFLPKPRHCPDVVPQHKRRGARR